MTDVNVSDLCELETAYRETTVYVCASKGAVLRARDNRAPGPHICHHLYTVTFYSLHPLAGTLVIQQRKIQETHRPI